MFETKHFVLNAFFFIERPEICPSSPSDELKFNVESFFFNVSV